MTTASPDRLLLRPEQAAHALGISRARVYQLIMTGEIPSITIGRSRRIPADALRRWVDEQLAEQTVGGTERER